MPEQVHTRKHQLQPMFSFSSTSTLLKPRCHFQTRFWESSEWVFLTPDSLSSFLLYGEQTSQCLNITVCGRPAPLSWESRAHPSSRAGPSTHSCHSKTKILSDLSFLAPISKSSLPHTHKMQHLVLQELKNIIAWPCFLWIRQKPQATHDHTEQSPPVS
jgi:hypothetical protein